MPLMMVMELPSQEVDMWMEIYRAESDELEKSNNSNSALSHTGSDGIRNLLKKKAVKNG